MFASLAKKTSLVRLVRSISFSNADKTQIEANKKVIGGNLQQRSGEFVYTNEIIRRRGAARMDAI